MAEISAAQVKELREKTGAGFGDCKSALAEANGNMDDAVKVLRKKGLAAAGKKAGRITSEGVVAVKITEKVGVLVEVNSETDFVAQNADFRKFVDDLASLVAGSSATEVDALKAEQWPGDADGHTVEQVIASKIGSIGENIALRRFVRYDAAADTVFGSYIHGNGKIGVLVEIKSGKADARAQAEAVAKEIAMHAAAAEPRFLKRDEVTEQDLNTEREIAKDQALKSGKPENVVDKIVSGKMEKFYSETVLLEQPYIRDDKMTVTDLLKQRGNDAGTSFDVVRFTRYRLGEGLQKRSEDFAAEVAAQAGL